MNQPKPPRKSGPKGNPKPVRKQKPGFAVRQVAANILKSVLAGSSFEPVGEAQMAEGRDRALTNRLVTTALKRHEHISQILRANLAKGTPPRSGLFEAALRIALAELLYLDEQSDHSALFLCVEVVRSDKRARRFDKLANGVLRQAQRDAETWRNLSAEDVFAPAIIARWDKSGVFGDVASLTPKWAEALLGTVPLDISVKSDAEAWAERLGGIALNNQSVRIIERDRPVAALEGFADGQWWVQDVAAALPAQMLTKPAGSKVLDLCAAPGGKTAQLVNAGYHVTAVDNDEKRMRRVQENLDRLQFTAELVVTDVFDYAPENKFDAILLDAPCSATGTFRRHPEVLLNRNEADIEKLARLQSAMIDKALTWLKPDGQLIYCTCSLEAAEGEAQMRAALDRHVGLRIDRLAGPDFVNVAGAVSASGNLRTHAGLQVGLDVGNHRGMDGFFAVRFNFA